MGRALAVIVGCALWGCQEPNAEAAGALVPAQRATSPAPAATPSTPPAAEVGSKGCVDAWLGAHGLNEFGDPPGTMYAGGTPLFDEKTGKQRDRLELVRSKHPPAATACTAGKDAG